MKMYVCCPEAGCTAHRDALNFLKRYGIEPSLGVDDTGNYLEFEWPTQMRVRRLWRFKRALSRRIGGDMVCAWCGLAGEMREVRSKDTETVAEVVCTDCLDRHRPEWRGTWKKE